MSTLSYVVVQLVHLVLTAYQTTGIDLIQIICVNVVMMSKIFVRMTIGIPLVAGNQEEVTSEKNLEHFVEAPYTYV
jgi:hypothetical protein